MRFPRHRSFAAFAPGVAAALICALLLTLPLGETFAGADSYGAFDERGITDAAADFFGDSSEGLAKVVRPVFRDHGRPNGYIAGEEVSGAIGVGLRYGRGRLYRRWRLNRDVFWKGPSIGFDAGGNASKVFILIYDLGRTDDLYRRIPAIEGSYYFIAGVGVHYQQRGDVILAPIRTGVGLRVGVNIGYVHYTRKRSWLPF